VRYQKLAIRLALATFLTLPASRAFAQSRPLQTEDPETVGTGMILLEAGATYEHTATFPASGLTGNLWRLGTFGLNFGVSPIAEIQVKGGIQDVLAITSMKPAPLSGLMTFTGTTTHDFPDGIIGAKVRFMSETVSRPAMAIKFSTRMPNEGNASGLGLNTTDFNFYFLIGKTVQSVRIVGNIGFGILGSPTDAVVQNDVLNYGISVARAVKPGVELVADWNGRLNTRSNTPPVGTESRSQIRFGARGTKGPVRIDGAILFGITDLDPTWGMTFGLTWVFKAFNIQQ
jgi:hypothetical protein